MRSLAALLVLLALPAQAQQRALVVPDGAAVVIPPRGAGSIAALAPAPRARPSEADAWPADAEDLRGGSGWAYALVPLAAGAVAALATSLPGGGGGAASSGPVRTR